MRCRRCEWRRKKKAPPKRGFLRLGGLSFEIVVNCPVVFIAWWVYDTAISG